MRGVKIIDRVPDSIDPYFATTRGGPGALLRSDTEKGAAAKRKQKFLTKQKSRAKEKAARAARKAQR